MEEIKHLRNIIFSHDRHELLCLSFQFAQLEVPRTVSMSVPIIIGDDIFQWALRIDKAPTAP